MVGIGLMCVRKLNALCDACHDQKMKCEYPGKSGIRMGSGVGVGSPMKGQPIIIVPSPKCKSLEVWCQEIVVQEWVNKLAEAHLEVDCDMVHVMCDLTDTMDHTRMGGSVGSSTGGWVAGVSVGVGWSGRSEGGISKGKGKGKEQSEVEGDAGNTMMAGDGGGDDDLSGGGGNGCSSGSDDDDDAPVVEYMG